MTENTADAAKTRMRKAQARHKELEEDNRRLREMLLFLNESESRKNRLAHYYFGPGWRMWTLWQIRILTAQ